MTPSPPRADLMLFGVPRLALGGVPVHVGARKAVLLLGLLALDGPLFREALAARLWPEFDAASARRNLRRELHRLRGLGVAPAEDHDGALSLDDRLAVDIKGFRAAVAAGDDALALALASDRVFDGLDGVAGPDTDERLAGWRDELLRERRLARERLAERCEREGNPAAALTLHLQALAEDGCTESAARHVMRLHAAAGDRAAAAAVYRRLQASLRDELGLEAAPPTQALAASLGLGQERPPAAAASTVPAPAAAIVPPGGEPRLTPSPPAPPLAERVALVGRVRERRAIDEAWDRGRLVYLSGLPGSGKTRLAAECAAARGAWLRVACTPADAGVPYAFAARALRALAEASPGVEWPAWVRRELAVLLPELGPASAPLASDEAAERLRAAYSTAWNQLAADNFNAIVFDDWQWCDAASSELCDVLADGPGLRLVALRTAQLPPAALSRLRRDVDGGRATTVTLDALDAQETHELLSRLLGAGPDARFAARLAEATEGNPFFIIETVRHGWQQGGWQPDRPPAADALPPTVREVVLGRVRALGEDARRLLEAASLFGQPFDADWLDALVPLAADDIVPLLEHAQAARLVATEGPHYRFAHDLVAQCLQAGLSTARRRALHTRIAQRLEQRQEAPATIARHWEEAGRPAQALPWRRRAAEAAWRVDALAETQYHYHQALADGATGADAVAIHLGLAKLHRRRGDAAAADAAHEAAVRSSEGTDVETRIGARLAQIQVWLVGEGRGAEAQAVLDAISGDLAIAPPVLRARAMALRARACCEIGRYDEAERLEDAALALIEGEADALGAKAELTYDAAHTAVNHGRWARAEALVKRAVSCFESTGLEVSLACALTMHAVVLINAGRPQEEALALLERSRRIAARCGHVPAQRGAILNLVKLYADRGRTAEAVALIDEGEALAPGYEHPTAELAFCEARYYVHYLRGDLVAARLAAERVLSLSARLADRMIRHGTLQLVADLYLHTGDLARAAAVLEHPDAESTPDDARHALLCAKRAWLALARGETAAARRHLAAITGEPEITDAATVAWVGAAIEIADGDTAAAAQRLSAIDLAADIAIEAIAMVLVQRLRVAGATARADAAAEARARELLAAGGVPALEASLLRAALGVG